MKIIGDKISKEELKEMAKNKKVYHKELSQGRWFDLPFFKQMANIGSDLAFKRALELLDLTIGDQKNRPRLKELTRLRETLADYFFFDNSYGSSDEKWQSYFYPFNYAARLPR